MDISSILGWYSIHFTCNMYVCIFRNAKHIRKHEENVLILNISLNSLKQQIRMNIQVT